MQVADGEDSKSSVCLWDLFSHFRFQIRRPFSTPRYPIHRTAVPETFPAMTFRVSIAPALFGHGILETMAVKRNRINVEVTASTGLETDRHDPARKDAAVISLARLIGRQIAREQFEHKLAADRKAQRQIRS